MNTLFINYSSIKLEEMIKTDIKCINFVPCTAPPQPPQVRPSLRRKHYLQDIKRRLGQI